MTKRVRKREPKTATSSMTALLSYVRGEEERQGEEREGEERREGEGVRRRRQERGGEGLRLRRLPVPGTPRSRVA
ncbi:hypothetical protein GCM10010247_51900 [Streptomyces calvus]|nr:hypothetical protein GCM10010247_51900 [Streptomyces calvus]